jgi:hypothetical protein
MLAYYTRSSLIHNTAGVQIGVGRDGLVHEFLLAGSRVQTGLVIKVAHRKDLLADMAFNKEVAAYRCCQRMGFTGIGIGVLPCCFVVTTSASTGHLCIRSCCRSSCC